MAIAGSGAVAQALGRTLRDRGVPVVALAGRNPQRTSAAASFIGPDVRAIAIADAPRFAEHVLLAVSDDAIDEVAETLAGAGLRRGCVLHTCGARGPDALAPLGAAGVACGVMHPLQTIPSPERGRAALSNATFGIGGDPDAVDWADRIVGRIGGRVLHVAPDGFPAYHAAAVLAGNGIAALVDAALDLMAEAGVARAAALQALAPLCTASAANAVSDGPDAALTGPVQRGDAATVGAHVRALAALPPDITALYGAVSRRLAAIALRRGLDPAAARRIEALLDATLERHAGVSADR